MKIRFNESVSRDYSRVGYDSVTITYDILEDSDTGAYDLTVPKSYSREQTRQLASKIVRLIYAEGIGYAEAYNRLVGGKKSSK